MTESEEQAYLQGKRQAALELMQLSLSMVGREHITDAQKLECERAETVRKLREICEIHGDNDWEDNFHLADVLERHLNPAEAYADCRGEIARKVLPA